MDVAREFAWTWVYKCDEREIAYQLEKILYDNKIPCQIEMFTGKNADTTEHVASDVINDDCDICNVDNLSDHMYVLWTPFKYEELAKVVIVNALNNNLDSGIIYGQPPLTPQDKIVIDHSYEVRIPAKFFWLVMLITFSPMLYIFITQVFK